LHATLASGTYQTGADRQIALYQETGDMQDIVALLMVQTLGGIEVSFA
jgi:hypothetical protein